MIDYSSIIRVHLEISTRCNASCPLCPRNLSGYDTDLGYPVHDMTLDEAKKIFTVDFFEDEFGCVCMEFDDFYEIDFDIHTKLRNWQFDGDPLVVMKLRVYREFDKNVN